MTKAKDVFTNRIIGYATKPADQFQANPLNYRRHPQRQRDAVNGSLRELGWIAAVVENVQTGNLIDGHERVWQALKNNEDVPYLQVDLTEDEEKLALAIFDPITNMAETDAAILDELLQDVNTGEAALQELLAQLATDAGLYADETPKGEDPGADVSKADELQAKWQVQLGDLWQLGDHRIAVGDCQNADLVKLLMQNEKPRYGMQDPPYGISVVGGSKSFGSVGGSKSFGSVGGSNIVRANKYTPIVDDDKPYDPSYILSVCPDSVLWGANYYSDKLPPQKGWLVWDKKGKEWDDNFSDCELAWTPFDVVTKIYRYLWMGIVQEGERETRMHPTQKPVGLYEKIMADLFTDNGVVIDFYLGSGTTLLACERLNKPCRAIEIVPPYVAVALQRWADMTGKTPVLLESKTPAEAGVFGGEG